MPKLTSKKENILLNQQKELVMLRCERYARDVNIQLKKQLVAAQEQLDKLNQELTDVTAGKIRLQ